MGIIGRSRVIIGLAIVGLAGPVAGRVGQGEFGLHCDSGGVSAGGLCIDQFEASVWNIPPTSPTGASNRVLVKRVKKGKVTLANLQEGGAVRLTAAEATLACAEDGSDCAGVIYAISLPGVVPTTGLSWWQAQVACGNSAGRLPTNGEWQLAATGTQDNNFDNGSSDCNVAHPAAAQCDQTLTPTGSRSSCVSAWGIYDAIGNANEWVADWVVDPTTPSQPKGMIRGGNSHGGPDAGIHTIGTTASLCGGADDDQICAGNGNDSLIGFRCTH